MKLLKIMFSVLLLSALLQPLVADNTVLKQSFNTIPGELQGGTAKLVEGARGKGLMLFDGAYLNYAVFPELQEAEKAGTLTFECFFLREEDDEYGFLIRHNGCFSVRVIPWDPRRINIGIWSTQGYISLDSEPCLKAGVWQHVAVTITPTEAELFIDGVSKLKRPIKAPLRTSRHPVTIGAAVEPNKKVIDQFAGVVLDEVEIFAGVRDKAYFDQIAADASEVFEARQTTFGMPPKCAPGAEITTRTAAQVTHSGNNMKVENSFYIFELDKSTMQLVRLFNKFTNSECFLTGGSTLFAMTAGNSFTRLDPASFTIKEFKESPQGDTVTVFATMRNESADVELDLILGFDDSQDISVNAQMRNGKKAQRLMPCVPLVENISIGKDFNENYYFNPQVSGWCGKKSFEIALGYGFRSWLQFADVFSPSLGGGLALSGQDTNGTLKGIATRKTKNNGKVGVTYNLCWAAAGDEKMSRVFDEKLRGLAMAFIYLPDTFAPGETVKLPPAKLSVHRGSVLDPLMTYAKWCRSAFPRDPIPAKVLDEFNFAAVHRQVGNAGYTKGYDTPEGFVLADKIAPDGSDHHLQLAFWWHRYEKLPKLDSITGNYMYKNSSGEGDYLYDPALGGLEGMKNEIAACQAKGTSVVLYTCSRVVGEDSQVAINHPDWALYTVPGKPNRSWGVLNVCPQIPEWQDLYAQANARLVRDLNVPGVYLDTTAETLRCYNTAHKHPRNPVDGVESMLKKIRSQVKAANPQAYIMTEYIGSEYFARYIDVCWVQTFAHPHGHAFNNYDLDFARFVYPKVKYAEWGMTPKTFEVDSRRIFFNGLGATRGDLTAPQKERFADMTNTLREVYVALATEDPQPFVPTLTENIFANYFPTAELQVWTYYNKAGDLKNAPLLAIPQEMRSKRFVELLGDRELPVQDGRIALDVVDYEVGLVAAFDRILSVQDSGDKLEITVKGTLPEGSKIVYVDGSRRDNQLNYREVAMSSNRGEINRTELASGKAVIKVLNGYRLLDEIVIEIK